jgi:cell division protein FtsW (lipid II flippase)
MLRRIRLTELQLLVLPSAVTVVGLLTIYVASTRDLAWDWRDIWVSLAFMAAIFVISIWFSASGFRGDQVLFPLTASLAGLGLLVIQRLAPELDDASVARKQLIFLAAGLVGLAFVSRVGFVLSWLRRYKYTWLVFGLLLMLVTMFIGKDEFGARLRIDVGPFDIQTSEVAKVTLVVFLAGYLADYQELITARYRWWRVSVPPLPYLAPMVTMWGFSLLILFFQNDLGTALLFFGTFLTMLYLASGRLDYVVILVGLFAAAAFAAYRVADRIEVRVANWLDPWADPLDLGYQQVQSDYAMATGQLFGTGLAQGDPTFIPAVHTDYVFSAIGEELGLLGTLAVLLLYVLLIHRGFLIALQAREPFLRYLAAGFTTVLAIQTLTIVGGTIRLIPLTGITLPFLSYGGSSLLTNFVIIGLLLRVSALSAVRR